MSAFFMLPFTGFTQGEANGDCSTCCDGIDNDGDGFVDWDDFDCTTSGKPANICPLCPTESSCSNGVDDDGDGFVDGDDTDCQSSPSGCTNIIWVEDFESYSDGTMNSTKWTTTYNDCDDGTINSGDNYWGVQNGEFRVNDIEGNCTSCSGNGDNDNEFITEIIDISSYTDVSLFLDVRVDGTVECASCGGGGDLFDAQYRLDGGTWISFYIICGADDGFQDLGCIDVSGGNDLEIRILVGNQANGENYYFDNITVCEEACATVLSDGNYSLYGKNKGIYNSLTIKRGNNDNIDYLERSSDMSSWVIVDNLSSEFYKEVKDYNFKKNSNNYYRFGDKIIVIDNHQTNKFMYYDILGRPVNKDTDGLKIRLNLQTGEKKLIR